MLFSQFTKLNIKIKSMRNEANRLEELFIEMVNVMKTNFNVSVSLWTLTVKGFEGS